MTMMRMKMKMRKPMTIDLSYYLKSWEHQNGVAPEACDISLLESIPEALLRTHALSYVLHFRQLIKHAKHYTGYATLGRGAERLRLHATGLADSSALCRHAHELGIGWILTEVCLFPTDALARECEKRWKSWKSTWICPICRAVLRERSRLSMRRKRGAPLQKPEEA